MTRVFKCPAISLYPFNSFFEQGFLLLLRRCAGTIFCFRWGIDLLTVSRSQSRDWRVTNWVHIVGSVTLFTSQRTEVLTLVKFFHLSVRFHLILNLCYNHTCFWSKVVEGKLTHIYFVFVDNQIRKVARGNQGFQKKLRHLMINEILGLYLL